VNGGEGDLQQHIVFYRKTKLQGKNKKKLGEGRGGGQAVEKKKGKTNTLPPRLVATGGGKSQKPVGVFKNKGVLGGT